MCGRIVIYLILGLLVPGIIYAQCPGERTAVQGISCGRSRDSTTCPSGSTCVGRTCCWEQQSPLSSPCDDPYVENGQLVTCTVQSQGQTQSQGRSCPGNCFTCRSLSGLDGMGLCCPETQRQGCASASPAQVAFEREAQRIRSMGGGSESSSTGTSSTGSSSSLGRDSGSSMRGTQFRDTGSFRSDFSRDPIQPRDPRRIPPRDIPRRMSPTAVPRRAGPMGPPGPCGVGVRPIGTCRRLPMTPLCPRGFYCAPTGFMGACCPMGAVRPPARSPVGRRMGPAGFPAPVDRFPAQFPGDRRMTGAGSSGRFTPRAGSRGQFSPGVGSRGQFTPGVGGREQFSSRAGSRFTPDIGRGQPTGMGGVGSSGGVSSRTRGGAIGSRTTGAGAPSSADFDRTLFGPPPREDFPGGPIDTRNTPRGECPRTMACERSGFNECYEDASCPVPLKCCTPRTGCLRKCLAM